MANKSVSLEPARPPLADINLKGEYVTLVGVSSAHAPAMFEQVGGLDKSQLYDYMFFGPFETLEEYTAEMDTQFARPDRTFYTILLNDGKKSVGFCALLSPDLVHRSIEVGVLLYSPVLQRTAASTEAMYLLARYAFEDLGYRRYVWTCNSRNKPSASAARRLGFQYEGLLRQHLFQKGQSRDSMLFSMLDGEWPDRKQALERWLASDNFDEHGKQKRKLEDLRS